MVNVKALYKGKWYQVKEIRWDKVGEIEEIELEPGWCFFRDDGSVKQLSLCVSNYTGACFGVYHL